MSKVKQVVEKKEATLGVVGFGYVGLPLLVEKAKAGFKTIEFDIQVSRVEIVNNAKNYNEDVVNEDFEDVVRSGLYSFVINNYEEL